MTNSSERTFPYWIDQIRPKHHFFLIRFVNIDHTCCFSYVDNQRICLCNTRKDISSKTNATNSTWKYQYFLSSTFFSLAYLWFYFLSFSFFLLYFYTINCVDVFFSSSSYITCSSTLTDEEQLKKNAN